MRILMLGGKKRKSKLHAHNVKIFFLVFKNGLVVCSSNELLQWEADLAVHCPLLIASQDDIRLWWRRASWCCSSLNLACAESMMIRKGLAVNCGCPGMLRSKCRKWKMDERVIKTHPQVDGL